MTSAQRADPIAEMFARFGPAYRWLVTLNVMTATIATVLTATIINVALPDDCPRFIGGTYTIGVETSTKGKLTLGIVEDVQSNKDPVTLGLTS